MSENRTNYNDPNTVTIPRFKYDIMLINSARLEMATRYIARVTGEAVDVEKREYLDEKVLKALLGMEV